MPTMSLYFLDIFVVFTIVASLFCDQQSIKNRAKSKLTTTCENKRKINLPKHTTKEMRNTIKIKNPKQENKNKARTVSK